MQHHGAIRRHRTMQAAPDLLLKAIAPYHEGLVVAVACVFTWYWLADLCAEEGIAFVLGHTLSMQAIHGGQAKNDTIDAHKIAALRRGGMLPQASVYPAEMRATRALLRRTPLRRQRSELLAPVHNTTSPYNWPENGTKIASKANREGGAARFADPAVPKSMAGDLALSTYYDHRLRDVALALIQAAKHHDAYTRYLLQTVPGIGKRLSRVLLYAMHDIDRLPTVQDVVSYCRLVTCAKASAGKRLGTSSKTIGNAHLKI